METGNTPNEFGEVIGNSPAAIYSLAAWQRGYTQMAPEKAASEVVRLRGLKQYQEGHKLTLDHVALLSKISSRTQSRELKAPPQRVPSAKGMAWSKVEARIKDLRSHPAYFDKSPASHKEVVAQVSELYRQLGTEA